MRLNAFGAEPQATLLDSQVVAATTLDVLVSASTGQVVDVARAGAPVTGDVRAGIGTPSGRTGAPLTA